LTLLLVLRPLPLPLVLLLLLLRLLMVVQNCAAGTTPSATNLQHP
jgi:hypothetical protein